MKGARRYDQYTSLGGGAGGRRPAFVKKFILASGSLKEVASVYGVSYPTVRLRLDRLIQKIHLSETTEADPYVSLVKRLAVDDKLDFDTAKVLITEYRKTREETE